MSKKKHMRGARHLRRRQRQRGKKSSPNRHDRSYYIRKERKAIIELRSGRRSYMLDDPWMEQILSGYKKGIQ